MRTNPSDEPAELAHALLDRLFALLHDCRAVVPQLEPGGQRQESVSAQAERLLYFALVGALEAGLVRTAEDALTVLRQASQPLGPMGAGWLKRPRTIPLSDITITWPPLRDFDGEPEKPITLSGPRLGALWRA
jgi:hypothetical protein